VAPIGGGSARSVLLKKIHLCLGRDSILIAMVHLAPLLHHGWGRCTPRKLDARSPFGDLPVVAQRLNTMFVRITCSSWFFLNPSIIESWESAVQDGETHRRGVARPKNNGCSPVELTIAPCSQLIGGLQIAMNACEEKRRNEENGVVSKHPKL
jgi:hypothetical protein